MRSLSCASVPHFQILAGSMLEGTEARLRFQMANRLGSSAEGAATVALQRSSPLGTVGTAYRKS